MNTRRLIAGGIIGVGFIAGAIELLTPLRLQSLPSNTVSETDRASNLEVFDPVMGAMPTVGKIAERGANSAENPTVTAGPEFWSQSKWGRQWNAIHRKALLSAAEKEDRAQLLRNPEAIDLAVQRLTPNEPNDIRLHYSSEEERDRFRAVDFLRSMVDSPDSEIRRAGVTAIREVLRAKLRGFALSEENILRSRLGDRIELFYAALSASPESVREIIDSVRDVRVLKSIEWSIQKQKEQS